MHRLALVNKRRGGGVVAALVAPPPTPFFREYHYDKDVFGFRTPRAVDAAVCKEEILKIWFRGVVLMIIIYQTLQRKWRTEMPTRNCCGWCVVSEQTDTEWQI